MSMSRGGFAPSSGFNYSGAGSRMSYAGSRTIGSGYPSALPAFRPGSGPINRRPVAGRPVRYRTPYAPIPYGYGVSGWLGPDYFDYPDQPVDPGPVDNGQAAQPYYPGGDPGQYGMGPIEPSAPPADSYRPAYQAPQPAPVNDDAVTLIFKDGRTTEQIHNYILTSTTLFVQDGRRREIAVADLDLAATEKANRDAGVAFQLPVAHR
jgi:hypothetical protein